MKVIAINGSPRKKGNTYAALNVIGEELAKRGIEMEIIQVGSMRLGGCIGCNACVKAQNEKCIAFDDEVNEIVQKAKVADGIILGSPVHFSGVAGNMKCFLDRFFLVCGVNGSLLRHKVGASIAAVRRSGGLPTVNELNHFIEYAEMVMPTSNYWNVIHGNSIGETEKDAEGMQIMSVLGQNMGWLIEVLAKTDVAKPEKAKKAWTNFVRD